jgi:hypothetical protein
MFWSAGFGNIYIIFFDLKIMSNISILMDPKKQIIEEISSSLWKVVESLDSILNDTIYDVLLLNNSIEKLNKIFKPYKKIENILKISNYDKDNSGETYAVFLLYQKHPEPQETLEKTGFILKSLSDVKEIKNFNRKIIDDYRLFLYNLVNFYDNLIISKP